MQLCGDRWNCAELAREPKGKRSGHPPAFAGEQETTSQRPGRVLILEDEYFIADQIESLLLDTGYDVAGIAATTEQAIAIAQSGSVDVAVVDIRLPGERDGIDAAVELRERWGIQSIFATSHDDPATRHRAEAANPAGWLTKPLSPNRLIDNVRCALALSRGSGA